MDNRTMDNKYTNKRIAVLGFGRTGKALLDFLLNKNFHKELVLFNDTPIDDGDNLEIRKQYEAAGVRFITGAENFGQLEQMDLLLLSPGVDGRLPRFQPLREKNIKIISEIEFAASFIQAPIIAVTGTNGKSTTVSLIHHFLSKNGINSFLVGNIGLPFIAEVEKISPDAVVVLEVSSFQLEEIEDFKPHISAILNVTPDHLDRYDSVDSYFAAKLNITKNQEEDDYIILNKDDALLTSPKQAMGRARKVWFSRKSREAGKPDSGAVLHGGNIHIDIKSQGISGSISLEENPLRGVHNLENLLAAAAAARLMGVPAQGIETVIKDFRGLPHRMQLAGTIRNVEFINDSKATNVDATLKSLSSIEGNLVLILGGKDKGGDFTLLRESIREKARHVILVGHAAPIIQRQLNDLADRFIPAVDFAEAVETAYRRLENSGGVVLLAPGCASFDMFDNFEHRGDVFTGEVLKLKEKIKGPKNG